MIPKYNSPFCVHLFQALAWPCWVFGLFNALLGWTWLSSGPAEDLSADRIVLFFIPSGLLLMGGFLFLGLGKLLDYCASAAHHAKYICWELRISNEIAEKRGKEAKTPPPAAKRLVPPPLGAVAVQEEEPETLIEKVYHRFD